MFAHVHPTLVLILHLLLVRGALLRFCCANLDVPKADYLAFKNFILAIWTSVERCPV